MNIIWRTSAEAELDEAFDYLLERNPAAALRTYEAIRKGVELLTDHPNLGRPGRVEDTRELVIAGTPYIVPYTVDRRAGAVIILRVLHGARRRPVDFGE